MTVARPGEAIAERICDWARGVTVEDLPASVSAIIRRQLVDVTGLCLAARQTDYISSLMDGCPGAGAATVIGHSGTRSATDAALINGSAAHGEDYDDTFEGTPVHTGAVIVPAVLSACEEYGRSSDDALRGMAAGVELMCRMALVTPGAIHRAGFHPTAVIGAMGAALGVGTALGLAPRELASGLGIAGSLASGIIEYLAEGTWTKRLHAGWAAQSGLRAAVLARAGFLGPRTVLDGRHGFFHAFTNGEGAPDLAQLTDRLGSRWLMQGVAFKPYACGTMAQPFIDCALALRDAGVDPDRIESIDCDVGEGTVHRLWEPLAEKHRPSSPYGAKFSVPFCIAVAVVDGAAGIGQFTEERIGDPLVLELASKVHYRIDPENEYPANYTGHLRVRLDDGTTLEFHQPHLRGGRHSPLGDDELLAKFRANAKLGGWDADRTARVEAMLIDFFDTDKLAVLSLLRA
jgi:2-methylcitrate dehydratase PrpD